MADVAEGFLLPLTFSLNPTDSTFVFSEFDLVPGDKLSQIVVEFFQI